MNERGQAGDDGGTEDPKIVLDVDGESRTFTAADVQNLLNQQASATQKSQQAKAILDSAERYGLSVDDYLANAEGSFNVMTKLLDQGIIDEKGNVVQAEPKQKSEEPRQPQTQTDPLPKGRMDLDEKKLRVILEPLLQPLVDEMKTNRKDTVTLMRLRIGDQLQSKFPELTDADLSTVFAQAEREPKADLVDIAKGLVDDKLQRKAELKAEVAKELGLNPEELEKQRAFEQDPEGGMMAGYEEKQFSFKRGKERANPKQAMKEFIRKHEGFRS
jgi:hypothetical protein